MTAGVAVAALTCGVFVAAVLVRAASASPADEVAGCGETFHRPHFLPEAGACGMSVRMMDLAAAALTEPGADDAHFPGNFFVSADRTDTRRRDRC